MVKHLTDDYKKLFDQVKQGVNQADLMALLSMGAPDDEYEPEVVRIVAGLKHCDSAASCMGLIDDVFTHMFDESHQRGDEAVRVLATKLLDIRSQWPQLMARGLL